MCTSLTLPQKFATVGSSCCSSSQTGGTIMAASTESVPVLVIGAGFSGITAIKSCLEDNVPVIAFEKTGYIGGLWRYRDDDEKGLASVMKSTIINTSKEMESFSDFQPDVELPNYMHNSKLLQYCENYANHFQVMPKIKFHHEVIRVQMAPDFSETGQWRVRYRNTQTKEEGEMVARALMVCIGHHVYPHVPQFPGLKSFHGKVLHSHSYKDFHGFENTKVVIIGLGNSAIDMAVELSRVASQVYLSTRRGAWLYPRVGDNGVPSDTIINTRFISFLSDVIPEKIINSIYQRRLNQRFDHGKYNLKPKHGPRQQHATVSDELPNRILSGTVMIKGDIDHFTEKGVYFKGEKSQEYQVDTVILATGYDIKFPFLPDDVVPVRDNRIQLYKLVFSPNINPPTVAMIGLAQPIGPLFPISEIQCRWAMQVFQNKCKLPNQTRMMKDIEKCQREIDRRYVPSPRHTIQIDFVPYMNTVSSFIGAKPNLALMMIRDPILWWACVFGPCVPYQYRLQGPYSWPGARNAVLKVWDRVYGALDTRHPKENGRQNSPLTAAFIVSHVALIFAFGKLLINK